MSDDPRRNDPDVAYIDWVGYPYARIRVEIGIESGAVRWFLVQLEYNLSTAPYTEDEWRQVAGFDHHPQVNWGHDITTERLHLDVYCDEQKEHVKRGFPPVNVNEAPDYCQRYLQRHAEYYLEQFARWHDLTDTSEY